MVKIHNLESQYKGNTFDGIEFTLIDENTDIPVNIHNADIKIQFRKGSEVGTIVKEATNLDGISISQDVYGVLTIEPFLIDWNVGVYYYDIRISFEDLSVKTPIKGIVNVIQNTTNG